MFRSLNIFVVIYTSGSFFFPLEPPAGSLAVSEVRENAPLVLDDDFRVVIFFSLKFLRRMIFFSSPADVVKWDAVVH